MVSSPKENKLGFYTGRQVLSDHFKCHTFLIYQFAFRLHLHKCMALTPEASECQSE
jgi:hypothetical protein